jgi:hypothetical protein
MKIETKDSNDYYDSKMVRVFAQSRTQSNACAPARMALALGKLTTGTPKFRGSGFVGMHVKPITAQEKFNFPRANAILARTQALLWVRDWVFAHFI